MGKNSWKSKKKEEYNGEDWVWYLINDDLLALDFGGNHYFEFQNIVYHIYESGVLFSMDENENVLEEHDAKNYEELMEKTVWKNGLTLAQMLRQLPASAWQDGN